MAQYHYRFPHDLRGLADEIMRAIPESAPHPNSAGKMEAVSRFEDRGEDVWITVPDAVARSAVDAVVAAHDPTKYDREEQQQKQQRDTDLAMLRQYLTTTNANPVLVALIRRALGM